MKGEDGTWLPFPGSPGGVFDADADGFGTLRAGPDQPPDVPTPGTFLLHGATTAEIGTGDTLILHVLRGGQTVPFTKMIPFVFASVPALVSYDDGAGNHADITYPVRGPAPGTRGNGFPVRARANGDIVVTLRFWRPQRRAELEWHETGDWIEIGGLDYSVNAENNPGSCPQRAYSEDHDLLAPQDQIDPTSEKGPGLADLAPSRPPATSPTDPYSLTFTVNLSRCGISFAPGQERVVTVGATLHSHGAEETAAESGIDSAQQMIVFRRVS